MVFGRQEIAFDSERDGNVEIYVIGADGSGVRRLTRNRADVGAPAWSPDGKRIAFDSNRRDPLSDEFYVMNADGSRTRRLTRSPAGGSSPAWSPDSRKNRFCSPQRPQCRRDTS